MVAGQPPVVAVMMAFEHYGPASDAWLARFLERHLLADAPGSSPNS